MFSFWPLLVASLGGGSEARRSRCVVNLISGQGKHVAQAAAHHVARRPGTGRHNGLGRTPPLHSPYVFRWMREQRVISTIRLGGRKVQGVGSAGV